MCSYFQFYSVLLSLKNVLNADKSTQSSGLSFTCMLHYKIKGIQRYSLTVLQKSFETYLSYSVSIEHTAELNIPLNIK